MKNEQSQTEKNSFRLKRSINEDLSTDSKARKTLDVYYFRFIAI